MNRYRIGPLTAVPVALAAFVLAGTQPTQAGPTVVVPKTPKAFCTTSSGPDCAPSLRTGVTS